MQDWQYASALLACGGICRELILLARHRLRYSGLRELVLAPRGPRHLVDSCGATDYIEIDFAEIDFAETGEGGRCLPGVADAEPE